MCFNNCYNYLPAVHTNLLVKLSFLCLPGLPASSLLLLSLLQLGLMARHLALQLLHLVGLQLRCVVLVAEGVLDLGCLGVELHLLLVEALCVARSGLQLLPDTFHPQLYRMKPNGSKYDSVASAVSHSVHGINQEPPQQCSHLLTASAATAFLRCRLMQLIRKCSLQDQACVSCAVSLWQCVQSSVNPIAGSVMTLCHCRGN